MSHRLVRRGIDASQAVEGAGPDAAAADRDGGHGRDDRAARVPSEMRSTTPPDSDRPRVDAHDLPEAAGRGPDAAESRGEVDRRSGDADPLHDLLRTRIDPRDRSVARVPDPDRAQARDERDGLRSRRDRRHDPIRPRIHGDHGRRNDGDRRGEPRRDSTIASTATAAAATSSAPPGDHAPPRGDRPPGCEGSLSADIAAGSRGAAAEPPRPGSWAEDGTLEALELLTRLEPELARRQPAPVAVGLERIGLPAAAVERQHPLAPEALAQRVGRDERCELPGELAVAPESEERVDPVLRHRQSQLLQSIDLLAGEVLVGELRQRRALARARAPRRAGVPASAAAPSSSARRPSSASCSKRAASTDAASARST